MDGDREVLSFDPPDGRAEPVCNEFYEDHIHELLVPLSRTPVLFIPLAENLVETRSMAVNNLSVFRRDINGLAIRFRIQRPTSISESS